MTGKWRILLVGCALALTLTAVGCKKQRAEITLKKTTQTITQIENTYGGMQHEPERVSAIKQRIEQANNLLVSDASQAFDIATAVSNEAGQLLEIVKPKQANTLFNEAREEIRVAQINDLRRIDPARQQRIDQLNEEAQAAKDKNDWDTVIQRSNTIKQEVASGLSTLQTDTDRAQKAASDALAELKGKKGETYAAEIIATVEDLINQARQNAEVDRDYGAAKTKFDEARIRAEEGIQVALQAQSREKLEIAETLLTTALREGVESFMNDEYQKVLRLYEFNLAEYNNRQFTRVLEGVDALISRCQTLVVDTKRLASDDRIRTMDANIRAIEQGGVLEYLPGETTLLRRLLDQARETRRQNDEPAFDRIKAIADESRDELRRVREEYQRVTLTFIQSARAELEITRRVLDEMDIIFEPLPGEMTSEQRAFDNQKRVRQTRLAGVIADSDSKLQTASRSQQQGEDLRSAILLAQEVEAAAITVLGDIYHVVAHNQLIELSRLITNYELEGARVYAPQELNRAASQLEVVKQRIAAGQREQSPTARRDAFLRAVETGAEVRADVDLMAQRLAGRVTEDIEAARRALSGAINEKTRRFRADLLKQVEEQIEAAEQARQRRELKIALETAQLASRLAEQAVNESNELASQEQIEIASRSLLDAQAAGAELYAGREIEEARRLLNQARGLFGTRNFVKAEELARSSTARANAAIYKRIDEAEAELSNAVAVGGWEYDARRLGDANTRIREAVVRLREKRYRESEVLASQARTIAVQLAREARVANFNNRIAQIERNLEAGTRQGLNFFQPEESIDIRRTVARLRNEFSQESYEQVMTEVEKLEGRLRQTLDTTDELVGTVADQQGRRLDAYERAGAIVYAAPLIAEAREKLRYAQLDYRRGLYKSAHSNLDSAIRIINEVELRHNQETYSAEIAKLFSDFEAAKSAFGNYLTLSPAEVKQLASNWTSGGSGMVAISSSYTPERFRKEMDRLYSMALVTEVPRGVERIHESVIKAFGEARASALAFERLATLSRVSTADANRLVDEAYMRINSSNRLLASVKNELIAEEIRFRRVTGGTAAVVNYVSSSTIE